jgi:hypothetical protein
MAVTRTVFVFMTPEQIKEIRILLTRTYELLDRIDGIVNSGKHSPAQADVRTHYQECPASSDPTKGCVCSMVTSLLEVTFP